jgi:phosphatidylglycerophosphate synthase
MFRIPLKTRDPLRALFVVASVGLFAYLIWRASPSNLWHDVKMLGWGFVYVIALAGISHIAKAWAWQLTLGEDKHKISFPRLLGLRLGAEAAGQLGVVGQTVGDSIRVSQIGGDVPTAQGVASVTLDRGLYMVTAIIAIIAGILAAIPLLSTSRALLLYAALFVFALGTFLLVASISVRKRWPVFSWTARAIGRIPFLRKSIGSKYDLIESVERALLDFHHATPKAFWASFSLNLLSQCMSVLEVCLVLRLMDVRIGFSSALIVEALTKLVNTVGALNPGNVGTYEGGTMLIGKMFGLNASTGLALGVTRRLRAFFWAGVGLVCLTFLARSRKRSDAANRESTAPKIDDKQNAQPDPSTARVHAGQVAVAIMLPDQQADSALAAPALARVGSLPLLLRTVLSVQKLGISKIMIVVDSAVRPRVEPELFFTGRLPECVRWVEVETGASFSEQLEEIAVRSSSQRLLFLDGNTTYHPSLLRIASEWADESAALAIASGNESAGIFAAPTEVLRNIAIQDSMRGSSQEHLLATLASTHSVVWMPVSEGLWQRVSSPVDRQSAEDKLDGWLVKPTDGIYARLNRRVSIPISRQLIKFPITANMVSVFTLGVGFASAAFFAFGGYWNTLLGAVLCLWASILDGCDGEVARLKLQESAFGCWLETICDYLFYLALFVGMTLGLWRSSGSNTYLLWGTLLLVGAIVSFFVTGWQRNRLAAARPEQLLRIWQAHADSRRSNIFLFFGRHTEFIVRRCFFPYALLVFALLNIINVAFILSAIGANLVWPIALYSTLIFSAPKRSVVAIPATPA